MRPRTATYAWIAIGLAAMGVGSTLRRDPVHAAAVRAPRPPRASGASSRPAAAIRSAGDSRELTEAPREVVERQPAAVSQLSGSVVDAAGGVVPFAIVSAESIADSSRSVVTANGDGEFRLPVQVGVQLLSAHSEAFSAVMRRVQAPRSGIVLELGPSSEIAGRVVDARSGAPLGGVVVSVAALPAELPGSEPAREGVVHGVSNAAGEFGVDGLRGGRAYRVRVAGDAWRSEAETVALDVGARSSPLLLAADPAAVLSGRVLREDGPCSAGTVRIAGREEQSKAIAANGSVRFSGLEPGVHELEVYCSGALPLRQELALAAAPVSHEWHVDSGLSVEGRVVSASETPLAAARVLVRPLAEAGEQPPLASCTSDERGEFSCAGLRPGAHEVSVTDPLDPSAERVVVVLGSRPVPDVVLHLRPLGSIRVTVAGSEPNGPWPWRVFARGPSAFPIEAQRDAGGFLFERLPLGTYEVYVDTPSPEGIAQLELTRNAQLSELELGAPARESIAGIAVDDAGAPLVDVWVSASASDPLARSRQDADPEVLTDERGGFALPAVRGASYDLSANSAVGNARLDGVVAGETNVVRHGARAWPTADPLRMSPAPHQIDARQPQGCASG